MSDADVEFCRHQRASHRGIYVAYNDNPVGALPEAEFFVFQHDVGRLLGVTAASDSEVRVRRRQGKLGKEDIRHVGVIMLAGMNQERMRPLGFLQCVPKRGDFHEIGPRRRDEMDIHSLLFGSNPCRCQDGQSTIG